MISSLSAFTFSWGMSLNGSFFFHRVYTFTVLGGREWEYRKEDRIRILSVNGRINLMGGKRVSPVDVERTHAEREVYYDENKAFSHREPFVFYSDLTFELRTNRRNTSRVWSLHVINLTGYKEFNGHRYNLRTNTIDEDREMILIPNLSYKIEF